MNAEVYPRPAVRPDARAGDPEHDIRPSAQAQPAAPALDPAALAGADKDRLTKQCTAKAAPCIATVTGTEIKGGLKTASIKFYN